MYGHFGQGCVHMRHDFDLETEQGILDFRLFMDRAADIVLKHGGSLSGEHGDGQARGALLPKMYSPELMDAFRRFKRLWDPAGKMNPGKLIDAHEPMRTCAWARTTTRGSRRRTSPSSPITDRSRGRRCVASAWAHAAKWTPAPCVQASWPPAKSCTPPAAARTCSGS